MFQLEATMKTLKSIFSAAVVSTMLGIGAASAADLAAKAMPYAAPAPFSWTGFYIGGSAGAGVLFDQGFANNITEADRHGIGALAGGQIGYNYQMGMLVLGIEGEGFWSGMKVTQDQFGGNNLFGTAIIKNKWDYDIAGRFGLAIDHALIYGKAGWAAGNFGWNRTVTFDPTFNQYGSTTLNGLLIGLGLEYAFTNNWTAKFEYDYIGFGAKDVVFTTVCSTCTPPSTNTQNVSANKNIFKVGFNYLFNAAPVVARY
jgi:outer membrane immunogenic protein